MSKKKIEPTDRMIRDVETWGEIMGADDLDLLRYILNHPDAAGLLAAEWKANAEAAAERAERAEEALAERERTNTPDPRPWEPLAPGDPLHAGDEVWREWCGVSTRGIFDVQHPDSQVYTAERGHLGHRAIGTWYVRRAIQELPTEDGVEIVPAGGGPIGAAHPGGKFTTHHATYDSYLGSWVGVWRAASGRVTVSSVSPGDITPGTWKVEGE